MKIKKHINSVNTQQFWVLGNQFLSSSISISTTIALVSTLGLNGFGLYFIYSFSPMVIRNLVGYTLFLPMSIFFSSCETSKKEQYISSIFIVTVLISFLAATVISISFFLLAKFSSNFSLDPVLPLFFLVIFTLLDDLFRRAYLIRNESKVYFFFELSRGILLGTVFIYFYQTQSVISVSTAILIIGFSSLPIIIYSTLINRIVKPTFSKKILFKKDHINYAKQAFSIPVFDNLTNIFPVLMVVAFFDETQVGILRAAQQFSSILNIGNIAFTQFATKIASDKYTETGLPSAVQYLNKTSSLIIFLYLFISAILFGLVYFYLQNTNAEIKMLLIVFVGFCTVNITGQIRLKFDILVQITNRLNLLFRTSAISCFFVTFVSYLLMPQVGITIIPITIIASHLASVFYLKYEFS